MKNLLYIILTAMLPATLQAQTGNRYQMEVEGMSGKTTGGGFNEKIFYFLSFEQGKAGVCTYTIRVEHKREQQFTDILHSNWQYFKWKTENGKILIAGLPTSYQGLAKLQIKADTLTAIKNTQVKFVKQKQPSPADAVTGKSYALKIDDNKYLAISFDKDSVWLEYWKNIAPNGKLLTYDETQKSQKYKWMGYGTHILMPDCAEYPIVDFEMNQLQVIHLRNRQYMTEEVSYRPAVACTTIEEAPVKNTGKGKPEKSTSIRVYKP